MADRHRVLEAIIANGGSMTSYEISIAGLSSNPSQRITDLEQKEGYEFDREDFMRVDAVGTKRPCTRYTLTRNPSSGSVERDLPPVAVLDSPQQIKSVGAGRSLAPTSLPSSSPGPCSRASTAGASRGQVEVAGRDVESGFSHKPESSEGTGFEPVPLFELDERRWADVA